MNKLVFRCELLQRVFKYNRLIFFMISLKTLASKFETRKLEKFVDNAPVIDESVKEISRADGTTYKNPRLLQNWISFNKSNISCRLNVGVEDIISQISGNLNHTNFFLTIFKICLNSVCLHMSSY